MKTKHLIAIAIIGIAIISCQPEPDTTVAVASVSLNKTELTMNVGDVENLTAVIAPSNATNQNVEWSSSAPSVVEVVNGKVTAKAQGTGTITVKTQDKGKIATCAVTVNPPAGNGDLSGDVSINPTTATVGETLTAAYSGTETVSYQWNKDGTAINGKTEKTYTTETAGSYTVTVSASGYKNKTSTAVVVSPEIVPEFNQQVTLAGENLVGGTLTATITGDGGVGTPTVKINGVNGTSYVIRFGDVGKKLEAEAIYSNGTAKATMQNAVATPTLSVELTESENDDDKLYVGETLTMTMTVGNVKAGLNPGITRSWKAGNDTIAGETGATLEVKDAYAGKTITGTAQLTDFAAASASKTTPQVITPTPIPQTYTIDLKGGALKFDVKYEALKGAPAPGYLAYIEERLGVVVNSDQLGSVNAVNYLLGKGNLFDITIEYAGASYTGMSWDVATQAFKIHNNWISTASDADLSAAMIRTAFNSVTIAMLERSNVRMASVGAKGQHLKPLTNPKKIRRAVVHSA